MICNGDNEGYFTATCIQGDIILRNTELCDMNFLSAKGGYMRFLRAMNLKCLKAKFPVPIALYRWGTSYSRQ